MRQVLSWAFGQEKKCAPPVPVLAEELGRRAPAGSDARDASGLAEAIDDRGRALYRPRHGAPQRRGKTA